MTPELYHPVLDCFMRALPYQYRDQQGEAWHVRANQRVGRLWRELVSLSRRRSVAFDRIASRAASL